MTMRVFQCTLRCMHIGVPRRLKNKVVYKYKKTTILDLFADYQKLVYECIEKNTPDSMALCENRLFKEIPIKNNKNEKIAVITELLKRT